MFDDESDPFDISLLSYVSPLLEIAIEECERSSKRHQLKNHVLTGDCS